jgi:hypothetical protein
MLLVNQLVMEDFGIPPAMSNLLSHDVKIGEQGAVAPVTFPRGISLKLRAQVAM